MRVATGTSRRHEALPLTNAMEAEIYKRYVIYGHSIREGEGFAASGTVLHAGRLLGASGVLELFHTEGEARAAGIAWAREWVDVNT